jgi:hypothetical protein
MKAIELNRGEKYAALVWTGKSNAPYAKTVAEALLGVASEPVQIFNDTWITVKRSDEARIRHSLAGHSTLDDFLSQLQKRIASHQTDSPILFWNIHPRGTADGRFEFAVRRGTDVLYFQSGPWKLWKLDRFLERPIATQLQPKDHIAVANSIAAGS